MCPLHPAVAYLGYYVRLNDTREIVQLVRIKDHQNCRVSSFPGSGIKFELTFFFWSDFSAKEQLTTNFFFSLFNGLLTWYFSL